MDTDEHEIMFRWIVEFTQERGVGPTVSEILDGVGQPWGHRILGDLCSRSRLECEPRVIGGLRPRRES